MTARQRRLMQRNDVLDKEYGQAVNRLIRKEYSQNDVEAILNNYIDDPTNEKYVAEFKALQVYRIECKRLARIEIYGDAAV